ncbi:unnamed protein product, partial [Symbiodinium sp. KB8]
MLMLGYLNASTGKLKPNDNKSSTPLEAIPADWKNRNVDDYGLIFDQPRCVIEDPDCPLPEEAPEGYAIDNGEFVCADGFVGDYVLSRCGHDKNCNKALDPIGCTPTVNCAPLKIDPCERDNV